MNYLRPETVIVFWDSEAMEKTLYRCTEVEQLLMTTDKMCDDLEALRAFVATRAFEELPYEVAMRTLEAKSSVEDYLRLRRAAFT